MYEIFYPFGYRDLIIIKDRIGQRVEGAAAIVTQISYGPVAITAIADEMK